MELLIYIIIGFVAQLIDGSLGMAYGVISRTFLRTIAGLPSVIASAVVHCSEIPVSFISGVSHWKMKNVMKDMLLKLMIPGVIGGILGAYFLSSIGEIIEPFINIYLIVMGILILYKGIKNKQAKKDIGNSIYPIGLLGGFFDATGGGGWGPVVTSTMIARGNDAKKTIGTVNIAEFVVTIAEVTTFVALIQDFSKYFNIIIGLVLGGVAAAPIAAYLCTKISIRPLLISVGLLIIILNIYSLLNIG